MSGLTRFTSPADTSPDGSASTEPAQADAPPQDPLAQVAAPLQQFLRPRRGPVAGESCEMCAAPVGDDHRHIVDLDQRAILCSCRGCALLFDGEAAAQGRYRAVPDRYLRVEPFELSPVQWAALQVPVGVAFVVHNTRLDSTVAFYPSPGGATESELPLDSWGDIVADNPALRDVAPDVEAVLLRTGSGPGGFDAAPPRGFVVPVDRCYELVGMLRMTWRGFDGGQEARTAMDEFFADVDRRARPVGGART